MRKIKKSFFYESKVMLRLLITYPVVKLQKNRAAQIEINRQIQSQVNDFYQNASGNLYRQAITYYKDTKKTGFPFHAFEAVMNYEITYNMNCYLSMYRDGYEFTGGAHGNTVRASDTWSLLSGEKLSLSSVLPAGVLPAEVLPAGGEYVNLITGMLTEQAEAQTQENAMIYFDDYPNLIPEYFNGESFFLTPPGIAFYYQQYEIAPYATGIVTFIIPYEKLAWRPSCTC